MSKIKILLKDDSGGMQDKEEFASFPANGKNSTKISDFQLKFKYNHEINTEWIRRKEKGEVELQELRKNAAS
ncbi:MAG: hypothetical protein ACE5OZ_21775 [Candidatus Heimdallarchaeota archaeon]